MESQDEVIEFFNPLKPEHLAQGDELMHASRIGCPVGQINDVLYTVNTGFGVRQVFDDLSHFSSKGNFFGRGRGCSMAIRRRHPGGPALHTALCARLLKDLAPARLRSLSSRVEAIVSGCVRALPDCGPVDLYAEYAHFIPSRILYALIGIPEAAWSDVQQWSDVIVATVPEPTHELPEFSYLTAYLGGLAEERRAHRDRRQEDVLDNLCFAGPDESDMSTSEVMTHVLQLVVASTDTTRALIAKCLHRLLENRSLFEAVLADRSLLPNAVEESLRLDSPAQFMVRSVIEDTTVESCVMEAGKKVYLNIQSANHDEKRWGADSRTYRIDRPNAMAHLAFGRGIHTCIGAPLARIEARVGIGALLDRYPGMRLIPDAKWVKAPGALTRRVQSVSVLLTGEENRR